MGRIGPGLDQCEAAFDIECRDGLEKEWAAAAVILVISVSATDRWAALGVDRRRCGPRGSYGPRTLPNIGFRNSGHGQSDRRLCRGGIHSGFDHARGDTRVGASGASGREPEAPTRCTAAATPRHTEPRAAVGRGHQRRVRVRSSQPRRSRVRAVLLRLRDSRASGQRRLLRQGSQRGRQRQDMGNSRDGMRRVHRCCA